MEKISELKEIQKLELGVLNYINDVCKKNNIDYFAISGTLLGAIRHNGFIPWDDDIDIALTRENYEKLINVLKKSDNPRYKVIDESVSDYCYPFAKVCDTYTHLVEDNINYKGEYGVFADIFYYDRLPNDKKIVHKAFKKGKNFINYIGKNFIKNKVVHKKLYKKIGRKIFSLISHLFFNKTSVIKYYKKCHDKYADENGIYGISVWPSYDESREIQYWEDLIETKEHIFEDSVIRIPKNFDRVLKIQYGDYMKLPPVEQQKPHHKIEVFLKERED